MDTPSWVHGLQIGKGCLGYEGCPRCPTVDITQAGGKPFPVNVCLHLSTAHSWPLCVKLGEQTEYQNLEAKLAAALGSKVVNALGKVIEDKGGLLSLIITFACLTD